MHNRTSNATVVQSSGLMLIRLHSSIWILDKYVIWIPTFLISNVRPFLQSLKLSLSWSYFVLSSSFFTDQILDLKECFCVIVIKPIKLILQLFLNLTTFTTNLTGFNWCHEAIYYSKYLKRPQLSKEGEARRPGNYRITAKFLPFIQAS